MLPLVYPPFVSPLITGTVVANSFRLRSVRSEGGQTGEIKSSNWKGGVGWSRGVPGNCKSIQPQLRIRQSPTWDLQNGSAWGAKQTCKMPLGDVYETLDSRDKIHFYYSLLLKYCYIVKHKVNPIT